MNLILSIGLLFYYAVSIAFFLKMLNQQLLYTSVPHRAATGIFDAIFGLLSTDGELDDSKSTEEKAETDNDEKEYVLEGKLEADELVDYLTEADYKETDFTDLEIDILENTKILCNYEDWAYKDVYSLKNSRLLVFFPKVVIPKDMRSTHYTQYRLMFWMKIDNYAGRYYFWDKNSGKHFYDRIRTNDDIRLTNYNSLTLQQGGDHDIVKRIAEKFDNEPNLEIEIEDDDLFIKVSGTPNLENFKRIEKVLNTIND